MSSPWDGAQYMQYPPDFLNRTRLQPHVRNEIQFFMCSRNDITNEQRMTLNEKEITLLKQTWKDLFCKARTVKRLQTFDESGVKLSQCSENQKRKRICIFRKVQCSRFPWYAGLCCPASMFFHMYRGEGIQLSFCLELRRRTQWSAWQAHTACSTSDFCCWLRFSCKP